MNRRSFLKGLAGAVGAAIILPPTIEDAAEAGRRIWALGGLPESTKVPGVFAEYDPYNMDSPYVTVPREAESMTIRMAWEELAMHDGWWMRRGDLIEIDGDKYIVQDVTPQDMSAHSVVLARGIRA